MGAVHPLVLLPVAALPVLLPPVLLPLLVPWPVLLPPPEAELLEVAGRCAVVPPLDDAAAAVPVLVTTEAATPCWHPTAKSKYPSATMGLMRTQCRTEGKPNPLEASSRSPPNAS
jgi:hypothetical protein